MWSRPAGTRPSIPEEPKGVEPAALVRQATDTVRAVGLLPVGARVTEYGSPHGGSWLPLMSARGLTTAVDGAEADVVLDCFGMMHAANQSAALAERATRVAPGGRAVSLTGNDHSVEAVERAVTRSLCVLFDDRAHEAAGGVGFSPDAAWRFDQYGGTALLAARRDSGPLAGSRGRSRSEPARCRCHQDGRRRRRSSHPSCSRTRTTAAGLAHGDRRRRANRGLTVLGYGAASRAIALLIGLRMPGTSILSSGRRT